MHRMESYMFYIIRLSPRLEYAVTLDECYCFVYFFKSNYFRFFLVNLKYGNLHNLVQNSHI